MSARSGVRAEQIYDAMFDDSGMEALPSIFKQAYGARSCTFHWRHDDGGAEVLSHSGYFSDAQMLDYIENFTETDIWTLRASQPAQINKVWKCEELVPDQDYRSSIFYNDWIRAMGDDT